jgi:DNA replication protein DnaC
VRRAVERSDPDFGRALPCTVCGDVARRRALRILDALPVHFRTTTLETFPRDTVTQRAIVRAVEAWERQDDRPWLYLHGPPGRGKTGLAVAVLRRAGERGASINFTVVPELLLKLRATYDHADGAGTELDLLSALASVDVLLLDDLAANRGTEWAAERLFDVLGPRYERRLRTLLTSNLDLDQLEQHLGHARLVSRIVESADILTVERLPNLRSVRVLRSTGTA